MGSGHCSRESKGSLGRSLSAYHEYLFSYGLPYGAYRIEMCV